MSPSPTLLSASTYSITRVPSYEPVMMPVERVPWIMAETLLSASVMSLTTEVPELTLSTWP